MCEGFLISVAILINDEEGVCVWGGGGGGGGGMYSAHAFWHTYFLYGFPIDKPTYRYSIT